MRVLGIDPGTATTGYGVVEEAQGELKALTFGAIRTPAGQPLPERLQSIYQGVRDLVAEWNPAEAAVEELFFSRNVRTAMSVGQARGVTLLALADASLPITEYTPLTVKQAVTGYGQNLLLVPLGKGYRDSDCAIPRQREPNKEKENRTSQKKCCRCETG